MPTPAYGPVDRFGLPVTPTSPAFGAPPSGWQSAPSTDGPPTGYGPSNGYPPAGMLAAAPKQGWPTAAKVAVGIVGGVVVFMILLAIAVPVFLNQREKPANRPVAIPATLLGMSQLESPALQQAATAAEGAMAQPGAPWGTPAAAYFGQDDVPEIFVTVAKLSRQIVGSERQQDFLEASDGAPLTDAGSGPYGGDMKCGPLTEDGVTGIACVSFDSAAVVLTVVFNTSQQSAATLSRQVVSAVEGGPSIGGSAL